MGIRRILSILFLLLGCTSLSAQRKVSADVEVKNVAAGKVTTVTKSVYCTSSGRVVTVFYKPQEYYVVTTAKGEMQMYVPATKEVMAYADAGLSSKDELISLFMSGRAEDLGLMYEGYRPVSTVREEGFVKKTFSKAAGPGAPTVEIVYENYLPIYCAYLNESGRVVSKTYLSAYTQFPRFMLPCRITNISYLSPTDSTVSRTLYSNVKVDEDHPLFDFEVPKDAKPMQLSESAK